MGLAGNYRWDGWTLTVRGLKKVDQTFVLTMTACNLTRMRTLGKIRLRTA
jgi:hypothetical protein